MSHCDPAYSDCSHCDETCALIITLSIWFLIMLTFMLLFRTRANSYYHHHLGYRYENLIIILIFSFFFPPLFLVLLCIMFAAPPVVIAPTEVVVVQAPSRPRTPRSRRDLTYR